MEHEQPGTELVAAYNLAERSPVDPETVQKAMRGDKEAFSALFMQTYRAMFFVVHRFLNRDEDIYDALQNGYIKAYKYLPRLRSPEAFLPWLKRTMENAARDVRADVTADRSVFYEDADELFDEPTVDYAESSERRADVQEVLSRLDPQQAKVLTLRYYDGMKLSEIAKLLDEPPSTVRSRFAQAKRTLVEQLKVKGIDKSLYGGSVSAMIAVCLRSLIGTDILSAATAQQMLDDVLKSRQTRLKIAAYKLLEAQRNRTILRAVSLLMALTVAITCLTVAFLNGIPWKWFSARPTIAQPDFSADEPNPSAAPEWDPSSAAEDISEPIPAENSAANPEQPAPDAPASSDAGAAESKTSSADTFVPDYAPGQANTIGNISQSLSSNGGFVAKQGDWLYFIEGNGYTILMKMKTDGSQKQMLAEDSRGFYHINVLGDWIYYCASGIWRIRTDGSGRELLSTANAEGLQVVDDTGYFFVSNSGYDNTYTLSKINLNTKKATTIYRGTSTSSFIRFQFDVSHDWLLYPEQEILFVINLKTDTKSTLTNVTSHFLKDGEKIYYAKDDQLLSQKYTDVNATPQIISHVSDDPNFQYNLLFYSPYQGGIFGYWSNDTVMLLSSSGKSLQWQSTELIYSSYGFYSFGDDYVYFYSPELSLCRARADGSDYRSFS